MQYLKITPYQTEFRHFPQVGFSLLSTFSDFQYDLPDFLRSL